MEFKKTCHCCLNEKEVVVLKDFDWGIVNQTKILICESCLNSKVERIAPWAKAPRKLKETKAFLENHVGIEVALVAFIKRENRRKVVFCEKEQELEISVV